MFSVPIGIGTAIYLEEYCRPSRWRTLVQTNIANLAGVPSIVYGILGLGVFVRAMQLNRSLLAGALTLTLSGTADCHSGLARVAASSAQLDSTSVLRPGSQPVADRLAAAVCRPPCLAC